jgi:ribosome biogenesis GTPase A
MKKSFQAFEKISWFPGHMHVACQKLKDSLRDIDIFIEVRDARLPYSTLNFEVDDMIKAACKHKIVIFNKYDLCHHQVTLKAIHNLREVGLKGFAVSAINRINLSKIIEISREMIPPKHEKSVGSWMMIGGMPNVGKSTIINKLRLQAPKIKGKYATKTSKSPAETRIVHGFKVSTDPNAWLMDTPGIMLPSIQEGELGVKLGLIGCINDKIIGKPVLVDYLFDCMMKYKVHDFVKFYNLRGMPETPDEMLAQIRERHLHPDTEKTCEMVLNDFRMGKLGKITLDEVDL